MARVTLLFVIGCSSRYIGGELDAVAQGASCAGWLLSWLLHMAGCVRECVGMCGNGKYSRFFFGGDEPFSGHLLQ